MWGGKTEGHYSRNWKQVSVGLTASLASLVQSWPWTSGKFLVGLVIISSPYT